jgi:hypothetical protein
MTKFEMAQVLFSDFGIEIIEVKPRKQKVVISTNHSVQEALEKELQRAKRDLSKIKRSHRIGKVSSEEVFDYEWRVHELKNQIDSLQDDGFDDLEDNLDK